MKNFFSIVFFAILLLLLTDAVLSAQAEAGEGDLVNKIDQYISDGVGNGFSGSILIVKEGHVILNKGYGMSDKENSISYTPKTVAPIGSVTKQFTATAILRLEELGKLKLTDPLSHFFNNIPKDKMDITIHQLLTHSAGLVDVIGEGDFNDIPQKKFFKTLFNSQLLHRPGSEYAYSNAGYSILARIIELASDQDYEIFLNEQLFQPAGMTQTGYFIPQWDEQSIAKGYAYGVIGVGSMVQRYQDMEKITWTLKGNGGIHSTNEDMYKWYKALKSNKIISKSSFQKLTTPYIKENEAGSSHYAYGWAIFKSNRGTKIISHNGGNSIYFHDYIWLPEEDVLIILFTNGASKEVELAWSIEKMLFDESYTPTPIKKNLHLLTIDYMQSNSLSYASILMAKIKTEYLPSITDSYTLNGLGYDLLRYESANNIEWAIEIFKLNVESFPGDGNAWDSLGEAYLRNGQRGLALKSYNKALEIAPASDCSWCKSSSKAVKAINKMK